MKIEPLLAELGARMGLTLPLPRAGRAHRLTFDGQTAVDLEPHERRDDVLLMHTVLGPLPHENRKHLYAGLLQDNCLAGGRAGAVSVDADTDRLVLSAWQHLDECNVDMLAETLLAFVESARAWSDRLSRGHHAAEAMPASRPFADSLRV